jgi:hypothetical protein
MNKYLCAYVSVLLHFHCGDACEHDFRLIRDDHLSDLKKESRGNWNLIVHEPKS